MFRMSFDELLNVKIHAASKQPESISEIPASVIIVTAAEIASYGYTGFLWR
ncbi:hypothetical protein KAR48_17570 [bacterium]|nr:hypothetical protein [bacterium]